MLPQVLDIIPLRQADAHDPGRDIVKVARVNAHQVLTDLIGLDAAPPDTPIVQAARSREQRLQVVTIISRFDAGEIDVERLKRAIRDMAIPPVPASIDQSRSIAEKLASMPPRFTRVCNVMFGQDRFLKAVSIGMKMGKESIGGGLREDLSKLVKVGILIKGEDRGYMLAGPYLPVRVEEKPTASENGD